ncbi:flagellar protein FlaG [Marinomonas algicola]|uniref:flagellar protein FlaG n=1 Tax=Marinomonas algicola TaxID=2773454 RepID=UPI00174D2B7F|nr:flagellar protein FlaG [Marinomonas algicola]
MAIGLNDLLKTPLLNSSSSNSEASLLQNFQAKKEMDAKKVTELADTNASDGRLSQGSEQGALVSGSSIEQIQEEDVSLTNQKMNQLNVQLSFEVSEESNQRIVRVIDQESGEVVRQMPSEEFLKMSERIDELVDQLSEFKGALINSSV